MIEFLKSFRGRVIASLTVTIVVAVIWLLLVKLPLGVRFALLAGLMYPIWIPVFQQKQVSSRPAARLVVFVGTGGVILLGLFGMLVWILANR